MITQALYLSGMQYYHDPNRYGKSPRPCHKIQTIHQISSSLLEKQTLEMVSVAVLYHPMDICF